MNRSKNTPDLIRPGVNISVALFFNIAGLRWWDDKENLEDITNDQFSNLYSRNHPRGYRLVQSNKRYDQQTLGIDNASPQGVYRVHIGSAKYLFYSSRPGMLSVDCRIPNNDTS